MSMSENKTSVAVTNPKHYAAETDLIEVIDQIRSVGFNLGSAHKYVGRLGLKGGDNTIERDTGTAQWYCLDMLAWFSELDGGIYAPKHYFQEMSFDEKHKFIINYYNDLWRWADELENSHNRLKISKNYHKRTAMAALSRAIERNNAYAFVGTSEAQFVEHVLDIAIAAAITIQFCQNEAECERKHKNVAMGVIKHFNHKTTTPIDNSVLGVLYKGSRSFHPADSTFDDMRSFFASMARAGLHEVGLLQAWGDPEAEFLQLA
jgi:hypothetical protein